MRASDVIARILDRLPEAARLNAGVFADPPETGSAGGMPEEAQGVPMGPPDETPAGATPELPLAATDRDAETGLPLVAMDRFPDPFPGAADRFEDEEQEADLLS